MVDIVAVLLENSNNRNYEICSVLCVMVVRQPAFTPLYSSAASGVYERQDAEFGRRWTGPPDRKRMKDAEEETGTLNPGQNPGLNLGSLLLSHIHI